MSLCRRASIVACVLGFVLGSLVCGIIGLRVGGDFERRIRSAVLQIDDSESRTWNDLAVAAHRIGEGQTVTTADVVFLPPSEILKSVVTKDDFHVVTGKVVRDSIVPGQLIMWRTIKSEQEKLDYSTGSKNREPGSRLVAP